MDTDYNNFAVFYGCLQMDSTGLCTQAHADSWILSRHTELPADKRPVVENITQSLCVNTSHYLAMEHTNGKHMTATE